MNFRCMTSNFHLLQFSALSFPRSTLPPTYTSPLVRRESNPRVPRREMRVVSFARKPAKQVCARRTTVWDAADQEQDADDKETMLTQRRPGSEELRISCKVAKMRTSSDNTLTTTTKFYVMIFMYIYYPIKSKEGSLWYSKARV